MAAPATTTLSVRHLSAGRELTLPVSITTFDQTTTPTFASEEVYGRMDPIFTYQNTSRTFSVTCQTAIWAEFMGTYNAQTKEWKSGMAATNLSPQLLALQGLYKKQAADKKIGLKQAQINYQRMIAQNISSLYQVMYPIYEREQAPDRHHLKGPPILKIEIKNVLGQELSGVTGFVFVPENMTISSGLADATKSQIALTSPEQVRYLVPQGSYGFTLGGTILHVKEPPGFQIVNGKVTFSQIGFPLGQPAAWVMDPSKQILK